MTASARLNYYPLCRQELQICPWIAILSERPTTPAYRLEPMPSGSIQHSLFASSPAAPQPENGWITAHCDGGARGNPGPAGFGAVIQDAEGHVLAELSEFLGIQTNNFAEYSGLLAVLEFALANGHRRVKVISDSELMVKQIQGAYKVKSPGLKALYDEARKRIARLDAFQIAHALRHKNKDADRLANQAMDKGMGRSAPTTVDPYRRSPL